MSFLHHMGIRSVDLVPALVHAQSTLDGLEQWGQSVGNWGNPWLDSARRGATLRSASTIETLFPPRMDFLGEIQQQRAVMMGTTPFSPSVDWAILGDGKHTAKAYDDGVVFAESTFEVTTSQERKLLIGSSGECQISDLPSPGDTTTFDWNQATHHLEMTNVEDTPSVIMSFQAQ